MLFFLRQIVCMSMFFATVSLPAARCHTAIASAFMPEVRLRKIHIVRPDLIPYPISYEIDC